MVSDYVFTAKQAPEILARIAGFNVTRPTTVPITIKPVELVFITLVTIPNTESATDSLQVLNSVHPSLSFTMEHEHDGSIPFLGTVLTRCGGTLTT